MKKILLLGTYPITNPAHGGQLRSEAIFNLYKQYAEVRYCAIYNPNGYVKAGVDDIAVGKYTLTEISKFPYAEDIFCGQAISRDNEVREKFFRLLDAFQPDIVQLEQCYIWLGLQELMQTKSFLKDVRIIYSSQNFEYAMKKEIYTTFGVPEDKKKLYLDIVLKMEKELAQKAHLVVVTTQDDKKVFERFGTQKIVIASNGIHKKTAPDVATKYWKDRFAREHVHYPLVFVGSAHIPNSQGFSDLVSDRVGFLPPNAHVYVAGGVCDLLRQGLTERRIQDVLFDKRISLLGKLSSDQLAGLLNAAHIILLPITQGGGSNLKTAEAILSGKKIVATTKALRSFDEHTTSPLVAIGDNSITFKEAILRQLIAPEAILTAQQKELAERVTWDNCLGPLAKAFQEVT
jgi:Glycosyl transferases group 1